MSPLETLRSRVEKSNQAIVARELGVSRQLVSRLLKEEQKISPYIAEQLGFSRQVTYKRTRNGRP